MTRMIRIAIAAALAGGATAALAQAQQAQTPAEREGLIKLLDGALPRWTEAVLATPDTRPWSADLTLQSVAAALQSEPLLRAAREVPNAAEAVSTRAAALRVDPDRGYVRYVNQNLVVDLSNDVGELPKEERVFEVAIEPLGRLGMPIEEFAQPLIRTQASAGGSVESAEPERVDEIYRLFVVDRVVNDLPVFGSTARVAVTEDAMVQRLRVQWPPFTMNRNDKLLGRSEVLEAAADTLIDQDVSERVEITARLGYAPIAAEPGNPYVPIVLIAVNDGEPTPMLISVPIVASGDIDER